jgi:hypothetical protein
MRERRIEWMGHPIMSGDVNEALDELEGHIDGVNQRVAALDQLLREARAHIAAMSELLLRQGTLHRLDLEDRLHELLHPSTDPPTIGPPYRTSGSKGKE